MASLAAACRTGRVGMGGEFAVHYRKRVEEKPRGLLISADRHVLETDITEYT